MGFFWFDNGLAPNMLQALTWSNDYLIHWRIYAALLHLLPRNRLLNDSVNDITAIWKLWVFSGSTMAWHQTCYKLSHEAMMI